MAIVGIVLFALLLLAVPIGIALSSAAAAFIIGDPLLETTVIFRQFFSFIARYSLTAIPLFIFAGFLMEKTGLIKQLFSFADSLVGHLPGGFGVATVIACVLFGAISGSSVAMAAAMSVIAIPEMKKRGYPDWVSGGLVATAGGIAILIPPSIPLLIYGIVTETSVVSLFFAGVIPGLMLALGYIMTIVVIACAAEAAARRHGSSWRGVLRESKGALPAFGMPVVILGGLYGGLFTPTEAAAAACGYAMSYGVIVGRAAFLRELLPTAMRSMSLTGVIMFLIGSVGVFQFLAANMYWPQKHHRRDRRAWASRRPASSSPTCWPAPDPRLLRRRRGDDPADRAGDLSGGPRAEDRPDPSRDPAHAEHRDGRGDAAGGPQSLRGVRHLQDPAAAGGEGLHPLLRRRPVVLLAGRSSSRRSPPGCRTCW